MIQIVRQKTALLLFFTLLSISIFAQESTPYLDSNKKEVSKKVIKKLQKEYGNISNQVSKQNSRLLNNMEEKESKLKNLLAKSDSLKAEQLFPLDIKDKYAQLKTKVEELKSKKFPLKEYLPGTDSLRTGIDFLLKSKNLPVDKIEKLKALSEKAKELQSKLQRANDIQSFVKERESELKAQLENLGFVKQLKGINKEVFYYQQQVAAYKELLNDKDKLKTKLLSTVRQLPAFQKFWQKNSYLASLFPEPDNINSSTALQGLQTRATIQANLNQRIGTAGGISPEQYFQQQVSAAKDQLSALKNKLNKLTGNTGNSDMTMPDFKPNNERTKSFLQRIEYGFNIQSQPGTSFLPVTSDMALTAGYKFSEKATAGFGASYKMGWGRGWKDIRISSEGIGLRSYVDIKAKGSIWISGGFEYNYMQSFSALRELHNNVNIWQKSALLGISKKYKVGKKEGNMQVLYDFLHAQQVPYAKGLKFRVGYTF